MRVTPVLLFAILLCVAASEARPAPAGASRRSSPLVDPAKRSDRALEKRVTLRRCQAYLGELMEALKLQSGVSLEVGTDTTPLDGILLTAIIVDRPLYEVMDALTSLFKTRWSRCYWVRAGSDRRSYELRWAPGPRAAAVAAKEAAAARWVADLRYAWDAVRRGGPAAERLLRTRPHLIPPEKAPLLTALSSDRLANLLRGSTEALTAEQLSGPQRAALEFGLRPPPEGAGDRADLRIQWDSDGLSPTLWIRNGAGIRANLFGNALWDSEWLDSFRDGWKSATRLRQEEPGRAIVARAPGAGEALGQKTLPQWTDVVAGKQPISLLVDYVRPLEVRSATQAWIGKDPQATVVAMAIRTRKCLQKKHGIFLLRPDYAVVEPREHLVAWTDVKRLRDHARTRDGYPGLEDLMLLARLTDVQRAAIADEFPTAAHDFSRWKGLLAFYEQLSRAERAMLVGESGLAPSDANRLARAVLASQPDTDGRLGMAALRRDPRGVRLRLYLEAPTEGTPSPHRLVWEVRSAAGSAVATLNLNLKKRVPLKPE